LTLPDVLVQMSQALSEAGGEVYLVGGSVRDALWGRSDIKDFDIEVHKLPGDTMDQVLKQFGKPNHVGKSFGITLLKVQGKQYDFALPRVEHKIGEGHKGFEVVTDPYLGFPKAASRRDFTINAIGLRLPEFEIVDPWNGRQDLEDKVLRHVGPAFSEDPLRALRAVQFAARFGLDIAPETRKLCAIQDLSELAPERFDEEFRKLFLKAPQPSVGLRWIRRLELDRFFPELSAEAWDADQWERALLRVDQTAAAGRAAEAAGSLDEASRLVLVLAALWSERSTEAMLCFASRFLRDRRLIERLQSRRGAGLALGELVQQGLHCGALRRLALKIPLQEAVLQLLAEPLWSLQQRQIWAQAAQTAALEWECWEEPPKMWIQGRDLLSLGLKPSPLMGTLLKAAFERQLDGLFADPDAAKAWIQTQISQEPSEDSQIPKAP
jgi:tRNA nucleotidyltransferase (CCA-adding enzyme)